MSFALKSGVLDRGEFVIQKPNGQKDIITPIGETEILAVGNNLRNSMTLTGSAMIPGGTMGNSTGSYAFIGGPSYPQPSFTPGSVRGSSFGAPVMVSGVPLLQTSTGGSQFASGGGLRSIHPQTIFPSAQNTMIPSNTGMMSSVIGGAAGIPSSSNISNFVAQINPTSNADIDMLASVERSAYGKTITTTLPAVDSSKLPPLQPLIIEQTNITPVNQFQPTIESKIAAVMVGNTLTNQNAVMIDADPITPGIQSRPGIVRQVGPSVIINGNQDINRGGCFSWILGIVCILLLLTLLPLIYYLFNSDKQDHRQRFQKTVVVRYKCKNGYFKNGRCLTCPAYTKWNGSQCVLLHPSLSQSNTKATSKQNTQLTTNNLKPNQKTITQQKTISTKSQVVIRPPIKPKTVIVNAVQGSSQPSNPILKQSIDLQKKSTIPKSVQVFSKQDLIPTSIKAPQLNSIQPQLVSTKPFNTKPTYVIDNKAQSLDTDNYVSTNIVKVLPTITKRSVPIQYKYSLQSSSTSVLKQGKHKSKISHI